MSIDLIIFCSDLFRVTIYKADTDGWPPSLRYKRLCFPMQWWVLESILHHILAQCLERKLVPLIRGNVGYCSVWKTYRCPAGEITKLANGRVLSSSMCRSMSMRDLIAIYPVSDGLAKIMKCLIRNDTVAAFGLVSDGYHADCGRCFVSSDDEDCFFKNCLL